VKRKCLCQSETLLLAFEKIQHRRPRVIDQLSSQDHGNYLSFLNAKEVVGACLLCEEVVCFAETVKSVINSKTMYAEDDPQKMIRRR
jgi:hypothetical protein